MSRLTHDVTSIQHAVLAALNTAVRDTLSIVALVGSMLYLDWALSLVVLGVYPIAALPVAVLSNRLRRVASQTQNEIGGMTSLLAEKLSSARLIKTFRLERYAADRLNRSFEQVYRLRLKAVKNRARIDPMLEALGGVAVAGVIAFAYWRIASGVSTVGDFMGFVTALLMAAQPIRALGNLSGKVQEGLAAAQSVYALLDEKPRIVDRPGARPLAVTAGTIRFENVSFAYAEGSGTPAITHFDLEIPGGQTVALVGRSGAGKSTVINLVPRLFDVTTGRILIDGQDLREVTLASLRGAIAIVSQEVTLFDDTIAANIALGRLGARSERSWRPRALPRRTSSSSPSATATPPRSATAACACPAASASGSRSRAPSSRTRPSCCSTRRRARSTPNRSGSCRRRSPASRATARRSSSPTASRRCRTPTSSASWTRAVSWNWARTPP